MPPAENLIKMRDIDCARMRIRLPTVHARQIWLHAQKLDEDAPFGDGPGRTRAAVEHLGYVQIDTINVSSAAITRFCTRASRDTSETTCARRKRSTRPCSNTGRTRFLPADQGHAVLHRRHEARLAASQRVVRCGEEGGPAQGAGRISKHGALTIRDIDDDVLVEKDHAWASRKPLSGRSSWPSTGAW
jgi:hypothetical protein